MIGGSGGLGFVTAGQHGASQQDQHDDEYGFHDVVFLSLLVLVLVLVNPASMTTPELDAKRATPVMEPPCL